MSASDIINDYEASISARLVFRYLANNLTADGNKGFIKIDIPEPHSIAFHIRDEQMMQAV